MKRKLDLDIDIDPLPITEGHWYDFNKRRMMISGRDLKVLKVKKDVPTVIEFSGRRYILEPKQINTNKTKAPYMDLDD